jgi:hypothetical protein
VVHDFESPGCVLKSLPASHAIPAAERAAWVYPANLPLVQRTPGPSAPSPQLIAAMTSKYWGPEPRVLSVSFLETTSAALRSRILAYMNEWAKSGCVSFAYTRGTGRVRVSRLGGGYWSYLGTDCLMVPADRPTMNLEGFTTSTPEADYLRVVSHETGHCLVGDTLIDCPRDLEKYPAGIPIRELVGQEPWVYAWSDGTLAVRKASRVWLSKKAAPVVRVKLRTKHGPKALKYQPPLELVGTPDHPVLLSDGVTWKNLGDLVPGDRVCSMYRQSGGSKGERPTIRWTGHPDRIREHIFVCGALYGPRPDGHDAHHKNKRKLDQSPDNLEWKEESAHHRDHSLGRRDRPETTAKKRALNLGRKHTDETRAKMVASAAGRPPVSDEFRARMSAITMGRKPSQEALAKRAESMRRFYAAGGKPGMSGKTASEETRARQSESMKAALAKKREAVVNHVVVSVEPAGTADVYDMTVPGAECFVANGVVVHNSLGFPHDQLRRKIVDRIDPAKAVAWFRRMYGWGAADTRANVLTPIEERALIPGPADETSIMTYQLPGAVMKDGRPVPGGPRVNAADHAFNARIYPKPKAVSARLLAMRDDGLGEFVAGGMLA